MNPGRNTPARSARAGLLLGLPLLAFAACDSDDPVDPGNGGHAEAGSVQIEARGTSPATVLAIWTEDDGWTDAEGNAISELPAPVENGGLQPLVAGGPPAELNVRFFEADGAEEEMDTVSEDPDTGERECTEHEARYITVEADEGTDVIAWPNVSHPDSDGPAQFAERSDGELVSIFRCDHVAIYPETAGTVNIDFLLWHIGHADGETDPLTIRVEE